jgi:hypothetical protein
MQVPTVRLGTLEVSRLIMGGNPFSGFSHQSKERDAEMRAWYTDDRIIETLFSAEALGLTAVVLRGDEHIARCLAEYWRRGGTMRWVAQTASQAPTQQDGVRFCVDHGASACFVHGGIVDNYLAQGREDDLVAAVRLIRDLGLPNGIAGHEVGDFRFAEQHLDLDFYMACYYNPTSRAASPHHVHGAEERFAPEDRAERVALIQTLSRPAIHYKVLAAGRIPPAEALADAARNMRPSDAVCVGVHTADKPDMLREDLEILMAEWVTA